MKSVAYYSLPTTHRKKGGETHGKKEKKCNEKKEGREKKKEEINLPIQKLL